MRSFTLALAPGAILLFAAACASANPYDGERSASATVPGKSAMVAVTNNNLDDVNVYVIHHGARQRLGRVPGMSQRRFEVPASFARSGDVRLMVDPIGRGRPATSGEFRLAPGQTVAFRLEGDPAAAMLLGGN